jgi:hypothetical protein
MEIRQRRLARLAASAIAVLIGLVFTACGASNSFNPGSSPYEGPRQGPPPVPGTPQPVAMGVTQPESETAQTPTPPAEPAAPSAPPPADNLPADAKVFSEIQKMPGWEHCTTCAGGSANAAYTMRQGITDPSLSGSSAEFHLSGATPYSNALWWKQLGGDDAAHNFVYDLYFYLSDVDAPQALEFDVNQSIGNLKFIFGTECGFKGSRVWRVWDTANRRWVATTAPCGPFAANQWHHLALQFQRTADNQASFVSVTANGQTYPINMTFKPQASGVHEINVAFQMDGNNTQQPYSVWLDRVTLKYW